MILRFSPRKGVTVEIQGKSVRELWPTYSAAYETLGVKACGKCGGEELQPITRKAQGNTFFEIKCVGCGYKLALGVPKDGSDVYARTRYYAKHPDVLAKKAKQGAPLPDGGWVKFANESPGDDDD